ncbi:iron response transcriptional regulator IrrA [Methyloceanibacter methanicus]|uniref:iron response transcriptional regulator IrrA n=1 Tax=Methyloceanibacter methanicus TaxID=1774968 RepID=UPI0009F7072C|nr:Fur family transcriptional regulator [Methyloceanibacter methanicus]
MTQTDSTPFSVDQPLTEESRPGAASRAGIIGSCPWRDYETLLREVNLRPTRQRLALGWILFSKGGRTITAEMLHEEAARAKIPVSLATVYNTLNQFTEAGLLRQIGVEGMKSYFDTDPSAHDHFFIEGESLFMDIPEDGIVLDKLPEPPEGYAIDRVDVVVRLRREED